MSANTNENSDAFALTKAQGLLNQINQLSEDLSDQPPLLKQLELYREDLVDSQTYLESDEHALVFIGSIGVGKTTAICHLFDLLDEDGKPLLSTSSGRTTLCEVEIREGPTHRILIDPLSNAQVQSHLLDFVALIEQRSGSSPQKGQESDGMSSEFERCIRNMLGLTIKRSKGNDGKILRNDTALDHLARLGDIDLFLEDSLQNLRLEERTLTDLIPEDDVESQDKWLANTFAEINHGRHPHTPLPKRIIVEIPRAPLNSEANIRIVDTKGLDQTYQREDIDNWLGDPRSLALVCSRFNDAPEQNAQGLLKHMGDIGMDAPLAEETYLLVLDRENEAANVMAESGLVEDLEEGRLIRQEQIEDSLRNTLQVNNEKLPQVQFFQSSNEEPKQLQSLLSSKIEELRQKRRCRINEVEAALEELSNNREAAKAKAAFDTVNSSIEAWAKTGRETVAHISQVYKPLVDDINVKQVYASSIRAAVNRNGDWHNFDFYYKLANAARVKTVAGFKKAVSEIESVLTNQEKQESLKSAHPFIRVLQTRVKSKLKLINERASSMTRQAFEPQLSKDSSFWLEQKEEWGQGPGYKHRIADSTEQWFSKNSPTAKEEEIQAAVMKDWLALIDEIEALLRRSQ